MKLFERNNGRLGVNLTHKGIYRLHSVHRLIASAYLGKSNLIVMHKDDNPRNNHIGNLVYGTYAENSTDMVKKNRQARGHKNGSSKLTETEVIDIRSKKKEGIKRQSLAKMFNVAPTTISDICNSKRWKHI